jgi:hypothetical protein
MSPSSKVRVYDSPLAFTVEGGVIVNASHVYSQLPLEDLLAKIVAEGGFLFIGMVLDKVDGAAVRSHMVEAGREAVARVQGGRHPRAR